MKTKFEVDKCQIVRSGQIRNISYTSYLPISQVYQVLEKSIKI